jgi:hypothetical protein
MAPKTANLLKQVLAKGLTAVTDAALVGNPF